MELEKQEESSDGSVIPTSHLEALWAVNQIQILCRISIFHQALSWWTLFYQGNIQQALDPGDGSPSWWTVTGAQIDESTFRRSLGKESLLSPTGGGHCCGQTPLVFHTSLHKLPVTSVLQGARPDQKCLEENLRGGLSGGSVGCRFLLQ